MPGPRMPPETGSQPRRQPRSWYFWRSSSTRRMLIRKASSTFESPVETETHSGVIEDDIVTRDGGYIDDGILSPRHLIRGRRECPWALAGTRSPTLHRKSAMRMDRAIA